MIMQYSIVNLYDIANAIDKRIDAEYWHPEALMCERLIKGQPLSKYIRDGYRVVYENTQIINRQEGMEKNLPFFVQSCDLEDFYINMDNVNCVSEADWLRYTKGRIIPGELLIEVKGNVKKVGIVTDDIPEKTLISGTLYKITIKEANKYYILNFLSSKYGQRMKDRMICNIATPFINKENLYNLPIPLASNRFQKLFEDYYKCSFKLIKRSKGLYKTSQHDFYGNLGFQDLNVKSRPSYIKNFSDTQNANRIDAEYFQPKYDEIINKIKSYSNGWDILDDIVLIKKGIEIGADAYTGDGIPFIRVSNLNKFGITDNSQQYLSEKLYEDLKSKYQPKKDDILLSKDGTPGIAYFLSENPQKMIISGGILRLVIKNKEYLPEYVTLVLNSIFVQEQIEQKSSGALIKHWLIDEIKNTVIPKLEIEKQQEIVDRIKDATLAKKQSKQLIEIAKKGVEKAIEENEDVAMQWMNTQLEKIGVPL